MNLELITEIIGWFGLIFLLLAFGLSSFKIIKPDSIAYQTINLLGSVGILISSYYVKNYPVVVLNSVWAVVSVISLVRIVFNKK